MAINELAYHHSYSAVKCFVSYRLVCAAPYSGCFPETCAGEPRGNKPEDREAFNQESPRNKGLQENFCSLVGQGERFIVFILR